MVSDLIRAQLLSLAGTAYTSEVPQEPWKFVTVIVHMVNIEQGHTNAHKLFAEVSYSVVPLGSKYCQRHVLEHASALLDLSAQH